MTTTLNPGDTCPDCGRTFKRERCGSDPEDVIEGCSEFCATVSPETIAKWKALQPGDFGIWPCPDCGCAIEDTYNPSDCCGDCGPERERRRLKALLKECLPHVPDELAHRIRSEVRP